MCILHKEEEKFIEEVKENHVARYKCRNCGKVYETKNVTFNGWVVPVAPMYYPHFCKENTYGMGDLILIRNTDGNGGWEEEFNNIEVEESLQNLYSADDVTVKIQDFVKE